MDHYRQAAIATLTRRWHEQAELYPCMRADVPLALYLARNITMQTHNERMRPSRSGAGGAQ